MLFGQVFESRNRGWNNIGALEFFIYNIKFFLISLIDEGNDYIYL